MSNNLQYITFDSLMSSVESDLSSFADNGLINRGSYIKIVRKVNHDIGLKIFKEKEITIKIENYKADLPEDFLYMQLALICGEPQQYYLGPGTVLGTHTEEKQIDLTCNNYKGACLNECGGAYWVTQTFKEKTIKFENLRPIRVSKRSHKFCGDACSNLSWSNCAYELDIQDGQIVTNFREGDLYFSYLADMVDIDNNILVLNHPLLRPYYEYAVKKHILENALMNGDAEVERRLGYVNNELKEARISALNFVNTVEYTDIQDMFKANRKIFYNKYQKMFDDYAR